jgi:tetratricopeptide (TPR) repeat protein
MAKKTNNPTKRPAQAVPQQKETSTAGIPTVSAVRDALIPAWLYEFKFQAIIVGLLAFALYCNTFQHEYALDDTIVIVKNEYVHEGFAGIPDILTKDAFDSYYRQFNSSNQLSGGRYRPLSILTFAVEQQFFGAVPKAKVDSILDRGMSYEMKSKAEQKFLSNMHTRHVFNVLWYVGCVLALLYFLRYIVFRDNHIMALIAAVLFTAHPIHTEVVANVKSRDEIMSLLLLCLTFIYAFRYYENGEKKPLLYTAMAFLFLAFLAKEYAVTMIILMPLAFYLFNGFDVSKSIKAALPYFAVIAVYLAMRKAIVAPMNAASDNDILNNPYANATDPEKLATKISTTLNYVKLLIFPHPLSSDYSYNTIEYKKFSHWSVWLSLLVHGTMFRYLVYYFKRRSVMAFAIAFYLLNMLIICNIIFNIGGTMGERLIFHSSVGFCIAVAFFLYKGMEKIQPAKTGRMALAASMVLITGLFAFKTIDRNQYWKNDEILFAHDIENAPNSVLVNANVASSYVNRSEAIKDTAKKRADLRTGIKYYNKALEVHPTFVSGYMNRGVAYLKLDMPDSAKANYDMAKKLYPNYPKLYEVYYNLGVCYYLAGKVPDAIGVWQTVLQMEPKYVVAQQSINTAIMQMQANQQAAAQAQQQAAAGVPQGQPQGNNGK